MFKRSVIVVLLVMMISLMSGCTDQVIEFLTSVNQLIDEQLGASEDSDGQEEPKQQETNEDTDKNDSSSDAGGLANDETDDEPDDESDDESDERNDDGANDIYDLYGADIVPVSTYIPELIDHREPFDNRLRSQGYNILQAPTNLPLPIPYEWVYVEDFDGNTDPDYFAGKFCFDIPLPLTVIAGYFDDYFPDITHEVAHKTAHPKHETFISVNEEYEIWDAQIKYNEDLNGNMCALVEIEYDWDAVGQVGEDPDDMISNEEMSEQLQGEGKGAFQESRTRSVPAGFETELEEVRLEHDYFDDSFAVSVKETIMYRQYEMNYRDNYLPKIFLYDSYLLDGVSTLSDDSWSGTMCTDIPLHAMVAKHLDMLGNYNADIEYFATSGSLKPNVVSEVGFAFNDEYGTGSWEGTSLFFITPEGEGLFPQVRCMTTYLDFMDKVID